MLLSLFLVNYAIMSKDKENIMLTGELKNKVDKIWESFWTGGITNPLDVIEQFTYLMFVSFYRDESR